MFKGRFLSYAVHNISYIKVYKRTDNGSQLQLKHVAMHKPIKLMFCATDLKRTLVTDCQTKCPILKKKINENETLQVSHRLWWQRADSTTDSKSSVFFFCVNECYCNMDIFLYMSPNVFK